MSILNVFYVFIENVWNILLCCILMQIFLCPYYYGILNFKYKAFSQSCLSKESIKEMPIL